jgi:hypothetical protein
MSDDEEYYEFEDEYLWEDVVPDLVVSTVLQALHEEDFSRVVTLV